MSAWPSPDFVLDSRRLLSPNLPFVAMLVLEFWNWGLGLHWGKFLQHLKYNSPNIFVRWLWMVFLSNIHGLALWGTTSWNCQGAGFVSNNWFSTSLVRWAANASYVKRAFSNPNFWHSARICLIQIASTQTFIKSSSIHAFSWVFTMNPARMLRSLIVLSVFPLKIIIGGSIFSSPVAGKTTVRCFFSPPEVQTTHSLVPLSAIHFDGTLSKKAGVLSMFPTSERGYFPILMNLAGSA